MRSSTYIHLLRVLIALMACAFAISIEGLRPDFSTRVDESIRDEFVRLSAKNERETRLVVIDINEDSLQKLGPWPWPRSTIANLVEILLSTYQAKAVGLDIIFPTNDGQEGDARLGALAEHAPLTLAQVFDYTSQQALVMQGKPIGGKISELSTPALSAYGYIGNHEKLERAKCVGNIGYKPDIDGVLRRIPALTRHAGLDYPHFSQAMLDCHSDTSVPPLTTDGEGQWRIPYTYSLAAYTVIPVADILEERIPSELIAGRYVLVGSSSLTLGDRIATPLAPLTAGVMAHAAALSGLLDRAAAQAFNTPPSRLWLVAWSVASVAVALLCMLQLSAWNSVLLLFALAIAWLSISFVALRNGAEWSISAPLWAYFTLLVIAVPHEWWQSQRRNRGLLSTLAHYVAQPVLDEILRRNLTHSLETSQRNITVLVADMENYTATTSALSLSDAATLTKDFLGCLTGPVLDTDGTLDKYTGDGLVAFWGAPLPCPEQADCALKAAIKMQRNVRALNEKRQAQGFRPLRVRIGIESGNALVGDLGTDFRSTYTAVGDCINFASRLEEAARTLPTDIVVGPNANALLRQHQTASLGRITLRGVSDQIEVFRPE